MAASSFLELAYLSGFKGKPTGGAGFGIWVARPFLRTPTLFVWFQRETKRKALAPQCKTM